jgi:two-component system, response regulator RegA
MRRGAGPAHATLQSCSAACRRHIEVTTETWQSELSEIRTVIFAYGRTTLPLACARPIRVSAFRGAGPDVYLDAGAHELAVEAGVYLARACEGPGVDASIRVGGDGAHPELELELDIDVMTIVGGRPSRRTPRRLFKVMPWLKRRELARFLRRAAPEPGAPRVIRRILAIDEDEVATSRYTRELGPGRTVTAVRDPAQARVLAKSGAWDLAIVELRVGGESGIALACELKREQPALAVALCSGYLTIDLAVTAARAGIDVVLFKPVTARDILRRIGAAADGAEAEPEPDAETLERAEQEHIARVLADCNGNITLAAHRLGIYRSSLQRRLRKTGAVPAELRRAG